MGGLTMGTRSADLFLAELRRTGAIPWLEPDAKAQVTFR